jgi:hypothetical protein
MYSETVGAGFSVASLYILQTTSLLHMHSPSQSTTRDASMSRRMYASRGR